MSKIVSKLVFALFVCFVCEGAIIRATLAQLQAAIANFDSVVAGGMQKSSEVPNNDNMGDQPTNNEFLTNDQQNPPETQPTNPTTDKQIIISSPETNQPKIDRSSVIEQPPIEITVFINSESANTVETSAPAVQNISQNVVTNSTILIQENARNVTSPIKQIPNVSDSAKLEDQVVQTKQVPIQNLNNENPSPTQIQNQVVISLEERLNIESNTTVLSPQSDPQIQDLTPQSSEVKDLPDYHPYPIFTDFSTVPQPQARIQVDPGLSQADLKLFNFYQDQMRIAIQAEAAFFAENPEPKIQVNNIFPE